jgi:hypothetical protein
MAKNKTIETQYNIPGFLTTIINEKKRKDFSAIIDLIKEYTGLEPKILIEKGKLKI